MAVGVLMAAPEFTKQVYDEVTEKMFGHVAPIREDEAPEGLIVHSAGQGELRLRHLGVARGLRAFHGGEARPGARRGYGRPAA